MKKTKVFDLLFLVVFAVVTALLPVTRVFAFTVGEEKEVGEKLLYSVRSSLDVIDEPDLTQYVTTLGQQVLDVAGLQYFNYYFFVINNKEFNAFAAPSGLIFFHSGLIEKMNSENELVSVLAHECGHVVKRHIAQSVEKGKTLTIATFGLILASLALGGGTATEALFAGSLAAGQSASLHFSRIHEEQADRLAYEWMKKMHRDPEAQVKMLKTMRQIARYRSAEVPQYLLTHPNPEARLDYVQSLIETETEKTVFDKGLDNTAFLRFKYRVLSLSRDSLYLRNYYSSIIAQRPADSVDVIMAKYGMAQLERKENNYAEALRLMDEVLLYFPSTNAFLVDKGVIQSESGQIDAAYETLQAAYDKDHEDLYGAYSLAKADVSKGNFDDAERLLKMVMYQQPQFAQVYFELGKLCASLGRDAEATYYLGKQNLTEGKLQPAKMNLEKVSKMEGVPAEVDLDIKRSLELIKRLEKK